MFRRNVPTLWLRKSCENVANMLRICWNMLRKCCEYVANLLEYVAKMLRKCCENVANICFTESDPPKKLRKCCENVPSHWVKSWRQRCTNKSSAESTTAEGSCWTESGHYTENLWEITFFFAAQSCETTRKLFYFTSITITVLKWLHRQQKCLCSSRYIFFSFPTPISMAFASNIASNLAMDSFIWPFSPLCHIKDNQIFEGICFGWSAMGGGHFERNYGLRCLKMHWKLNFQHDNLGSTFSHHFVSNSVFIK